MPQCVLMGVLQLGDVTGHTIHDDHGTIQAYNDLGSSHDYFPRTSASPSYTSEPSP